MAPRVVFVMADYGHDPTETAVPFTAFKKAGFEVSFATENGKSPECDEKMLEGITQKLLVGTLYRPLLTMQGATADTVKQYAAMKEDQSIRQPLSWSDSSFSLEHFDLVFLPGGHEKGVRQVIDSPIVHAHLAEYFPRTRRPSKKTVAAICHGVMVLSETHTTDNKSVLHDVETTALPGAMESFAFWGTRIFLGDYYKTYGAGSDNVETSVKKKLDNPSQFKNSLSTSPFIHEDTTYNYVSGRFPPDAKILAEKAIEMVRSSLGE